MAMPGYAGGTPFYHTHINGIEPVVQKLQQCIDGLHTQALTVRDGDFQYHLAQLTAKGNFPSQMQMGSRNSLRLAHTFGQQVQKHGSDLFVVRCQRCDNSVLVVSYGLVIFQDCKYFGCLVPQFMNVGQVNIDDIQMKVLQVLEGGD